EISFCELYDRILSYKDEALFHDVLEPAIPFAHHRLQRRRHIRDMSPSLTNEDAWDLYALSRVNAVLLHPFQPQRRQQVNHPPLPLDDYGQFFSRLGFEISYPDRFSPFFHEIVWVDQIECGPPVVKELLWPAVMFGDLLFSRAGARIEAGPERIDKNL